METSASINEIAKALTAAQAAMSSAKRDAQNPAFRSRYSSLLAVLSAAKPALADHGLALVQCPSADGPVVTVESTLLHSSGEFLRSSMTLTAGDLRPQAIGSAISYARRYAASAMLGLASADEDDDGEQAERKPKDESKKKQEPSRYRQMLEVIREVKGQMPEELYYEVLQQFQYNHANEIPDLAAGRKVYLELKRALLQLGRSPAAVPGASSLQ